MEVDGRSRAESLELLYRKQHPEPSKYIFGICWSNWVVIVPFPFEPWFKLQNRRENILSSPPPKPWQRTNLNTKTKQRTRRKRTLGKCWKEQTFTKNSNKPTNLAGKYFLQDSQPGSHKNHINKCQPNIHYKSHLEHPFKCRYSFPCCC